MSRFRSHATPEIEQVMSAAGNALAAAMNRFDQVAFEKDPKVKRKATNEEFFAAVRAIRDSANDALDACREAGIGGAG